MSKKTKPKKRSTRQSRRRKTMRRFADVTSMNIIKGVYEDARSLRSKGKRPNCPKAIKGFAIARRLAREPAELDLLERAGTLIEKNCQDELEAYELGLEEAERDTSPIGGGTGTIMLRTIPSSRYSIDPLTQRTIKMSAEEAARTGFRRAQDVKRAADEVRGTFKVVKPVLDVDGSVRQNPDGSPQMKVVKRDLSIRAIKRAVNKGEIDAARAIELLHSYDKLNEARRAVAEERRRTDVTTMPERAPSTTTRGKYAKTFLYRGKQDKLPIETAEYARLMRRRGEGVTEQLVNLQTGQRLQREWNPKAKKWRQAYPVVTKPLKGWWY